MPEIVSLHDQSRGGHVDLVENQRNQHHNHQQTKKIFGFYLQNMSVNE